MCASADTNCPFPNRSTSCCKHRSAMARLTSEWDHPPTPGGCSPVACRDAPSAPPGSQKGSERSASPPKLADGPHLSTSPPDSPPPSSRTCSTCTPQPPSAGSAKQQATGTATPPNWPGSGNHQP